MRKLFFKSIIAMGVVISLIACKKVEPTAITEENVGTATITGDVTYMSNSATEAIAADVPVYVDVNMSCFGDDFTGVKRYSTTTDNKGFFTIDIPVPNADTATGTVIVSFDENYSESSKVYNAHFEKADAFSVQNGCSAYMNFKKINYLYKQ